MKKGNILLWVILLIILDQAVKMIIHHSFIDLNIVLVPNLLEFKPNFNPNYSFWTSRFGVNMGIVAHLTMFSLIWTFIFLLYKFYHKVDTKNKLLDVALIFLTAGFISSYMCIIFWEQGVLDFIFVKPLNIVCDLKDLYINIFILLWVISISSISAKHHIRSKDVVQYIRSLFYNRLK